jgi:hypothetical protein
MHAWGYVKNRKKRLLVALVLLTRFLPRAKYTRIVAHEQPWRPHGQPAYQRARDEVRFHTPKKLITPVVQWIKNAHPNKKMP